MAKKLVVNPTTGNLDVVSIENKEDVGLGNVTNDKQIPLEGTAQGTSGGPFPITSVVFNFSGFSYVFAVPNNTFLVGDTITVTGTTLGTFDDTYVIDSLIISGTSFNATKQGGFFPCPTPSTGCSSFSYTNTYTGSAQGPAVPGDPVTGIVDFSAQPDTLSGFNSLSTITQGILDAATILPNGVVNTTDATVTTIDTIDDLTDDSSHLIDVHVSTEQDNNASGGVWMKRLFVTKRAGVPVIQQETNVFASDDAPGADLTSNSVTFAVNGGNIDIQVKGAASNYKWDSKYEILQKTTN